MMGSPYHRRAKSFVETCIAQQELFYLGWPTVMSYLRIATHPAVLTVRYPPDEAMKNIETLLSLPHARFLSEAEGFWHVYHTTTSGIPTRGDLLPDGHLAALLRYHGVKTLYTHDRDFLKFPFLDVRDPFAGNPR